MELTHAGAAPASENENVPAEATSAEADDITTPVIPILKVKREFFPLPEKAEEAQAAHTFAVEAAKEAGLEPKYNWDTSEEIPEGYGLAILPIDKKADKRGEQQVRVGLAIAVLPSPALVFASEETEIIKWREEMVTNTCMNKVANAVRPKRDKAGNPIPITSVPLSLHDFATSSRPQTTAVWNKFAPDMLKVLQQKQAAFKVITAATFRRICASAEVAKQFAPNVPQKVWRNVIGIMRKEAEGSGEQLQVFDDMLETRDTASALEIAFEGLEEFATADV